MVFISTGLGDARLDTLKLGQAAAGKEPSGTGGTALVNEGEQTRGKEAKAADGTMTQGTLREGSWLAARLMAPGAWFAENRKLKLLNPKAKREKTKH